MKTMFVQRVLLFLVLAGSVAGVTFAAAQSCNRFGRCIEIVNDSVFSGESSLLPRVRR